jgi:LysR family cyn operon transcriptional activator
MDDNQRFLAALRAFVGVGEFRSLKEAADRNGLPSSGSLGNHLNDFDESLGYKVSHGATRTDAGKRIDDDAKKLLNDLEKSICRAREHLQWLVQLDRPVGIAVSPTIWMWGAGPDKLPLTNKLPDHPSAEFLVANSARVEQVVRDGLFEIGITASQHTKGPADHAYKAELFGADEIVVLVPPEHEWADRHHLSAKDLTDTRLITLDITAHARQIVDAAMHEAGLDLAVPLEEAAIAELVLQDALRSNQPALVPELALGTEQGREVIAAGFASKRVENLNLKRNFVLIYQHPKTLRPAAKATLKVLRSLQFKQIATASQTDIPS